MVKGKGHCRPCNNKYGKIYYADNRTARLKGIARNVATLRKRRQELVDKLKNVPCKICGNRFHPVAMDFDHRAGEVKLAEISMLVKSRGCSLERLLAEIAKCDLICACCHRVLTWQRRRAVAQQVEHTIDNREATGSRPVCATI